MPQVIKRDNRREPFDAGKLRSGIVRALEKRPVQAEQVEAVIESLSHQVRALGEREVASRKLGALVMEELKELDQVAYVRFASVYRSFQDVEAFQEEIERLRRSRRRTGDDRQLQLLPDDKG